MMMQEIHYFYGQKFARLYLKALVLLMMFGWLLGYGHILQLCHCSRLETMLHEYSGFGHERVGVFLASGFILVGLLESRLGASIVLRTTGLVYPKRRWMVCWSDMEVPYDAIKRITRIGSVLQIETAGEILYIDGGRLAGSHQLDEIQRLLEFRTGLKLNQADEGKLEGLILASMNQLIYRSTLCNFAVLIAVIMLTLF